MKYRIIVLNNNEVDMGIEEYVESQNKVIDLETNDIRNIWKLMLNEFEGMNYCILIDDNILCSGAFDPYDFEIIEGYLNNNGKDCKSEKLRIYHYPQLGSGCIFYQDVKCIKEAWKILNLLWDYDLFQYNNQLKPDYSSASGLEWYDNEFNEWVEWNDQDGYEIREHFEALNDKRKVL